MIGSVTLERIKSKVNGRCNETMPKGATSTFDLDDLTIARRKLHWRGNVIVCDPELGEVLYDLLLRNLSNAEYKDRKSERIIDGQKYCTIKFYSPHIQYLTIAGSALLEYEYYLVEAPETEESGEIILNKPENAVRRIGVSA